MDLKDQWVYLSAVAVLHFQQWKKYAIVQLVFHCSEREMVV